MDDINKHERPPYGIISILMIGAFIAFLNNTLLNIALPSIMADLQVETSVGQWLATGFMLMNGILIPATAFLIQKYSVRQLFLTAIGLFTMGSLLAGFAPIFPVLLAGRMIQAAGSALLMPLLMNVMLVSFPVERRGVAMGMFGMIMMGAPAIGPTLSGWIVENYNWRMLFHFITPIVAMTFFIGLFLLKDKKEKVNMRIDLLSLLLSSIGFGGILFGFSSGGTSGFDSPKVYLPVLLGAISLTVFIIRQNKMKKPMLNFKIFRYPNYTLSVAISLTITMALFSGMLLIPIYVQTLRGISPLDAGLMMLPGAVVMSMMSPLTGKLFDKYGGRVLVVTGLLITTVTTYYFSRLTFETTYMFLLILNTIRSLGMSMVFMPVSTNGLNELPAPFYPHGTAMNNTFQQVSGAIGTALLVTIMSIRQKIYATDAIKQVEGTVSPALEQQIQAKAMLGGINDAFLVATIISLIALILSFFIKRAKQAEYIPDAENA